MAVPLFQLVVKHLKDPAAFAASLTAPALIWEGPPVRPEAPGGFDSFDSQPTQAGRDEGEVGSGEVRVYFVQKDKRIVNPVSNGVTVGRLLTNDIVVDVASVSRFHAVLQRDEKTGAWSLSDAGSDNGTFVDGQRLAAQQPRPLADGTRVRFGATELTFVMPAGLVRYVAKKAAEP